jgi:small GTP-binding protein
MNDYRNKIPPVEESDLQEILSALTKEITQNPPTVGLVGVSGVGKSSTINALFRTTLPTSDTVACTKEFVDIDLTVGFKKDIIEDQPVSLRIVDAPGLGEDIKKDFAYLDLYEKHLGRCDVVLWVVSARNRAIALDQQYLQQLREFHSKMVFGINQVDIVEPMDWRTGFNIPSRTQEHNIQAIEKDRIEKIRSILGRDLPVVSYSSKYGYRLELLFKTVLEACPTERRWIYEGLKNFSYRDYMSVGMRNAPVARTVGLLARLLTGQGKGGGDES